MENFTLVFSHNGSTVTFNAPTFEMLLEKYGAWERKYAPDAIVDLNTGVTEYRDLEV